MIFIFIVMKQYFLLSFYVVLALAAGAQTRWQNPTPSGYPIKKITFTDPARGFMLNSNGDLFVTSDTANSWHLHQNFPLSLALKMNQGTGIIPCVDGTVYLSKDNGNNWVRQTNTGSQFLEWADIVNRDTVFLLKTSGTYSYIYVLLRSTDRGQSWQTMNSNLTYYNTNSFDFINGQTGFASRFDGVYKTTDGGVNWVNVYPINNSAAVTLIRFADTQRGYAYREGYGMLKTTDGGNTWTLRALPDDIFDIFFVNSSVLYAVGELGMVYKSIDGGDSWTYISPTVRIAVYDFYSQYFFNENHGLVTGLRGRILRTRNGGTSWQPYSPTYVDFRSLSFPDNLNGYAITGDRIFKTTNGGNRWDTLSVNISSFFNSQFDQAYFWHKDSGIVTATEYTRLYRTTDGGATWNMYPIPATNQYHYFTGFSFLNKDTGFISQRTCCGSSGLFKTTNSGISWQEIGQYQLFDKIQFLTSLFGYATRNDRVFRTSNGGLNWAEFQIGVNSRINSICFINPAKGFIACDQGYLKMTLDSGRNWNDIVLPIPPYSLASDLGNIRFFDQLTGYVTDKSGKFYKTTDGGSTWRYAGSTAFYETNAISFRQDSVVTLAGVNGHIIAVDMAECRIESLTANNCLSTPLIATIDVIDSRADSIYFEFGINNFNQQIAATPFNLVRNKQNITALPAGLIPDTVYQFRVRAKHRGQTRYSSQFSFSTKPTPVPQITATGNLLSSSASSGNQWYLNGQPIPNATSTQYNATVSGSYSVSATVNNCTSLPSTAVNLVVTAVSNNNLPENGISIFPNPASGQELLLDIKWRGHFSYQVCNTTGHQVQSGIFQFGRNTLSLRGLAPGVYMLRIVQVNGQAKYITRFVRL